MTSTISNGLFEPTISPVNNRGRTPVGLRQGAHLTDIGRWPKQKFRLLQWR